jgi:hypothetical protein
MPGRRWAGGLGPRERIVPLNSWPMVMGRDSFVTGCGVTGEKLCAVSITRTRLAHLARGESILGTGEVFVEVWKISSVLARSECSRPTTTVILHTCSTNADKRRLDSHLSFQQLLGRRGDIVLDPDIFLAVVSRGTHLLCLVECGEG